MLKRKLKTKIVPYIVSQTYSSDGGIKYEVKAKVGQFWLLPFLRYKSMGYFTTKDKALKYEKELKID